MKKIILFIIIFNFQALLADQNDPNLDDLFENLKDPQNIENQESIISQIWTSWTKIDDLYTQKIMDSLPIYFAKQKYTEAIEVLNNIILQFPEYSEAYNKRATVYFILGDFNSSMEDIKSTLNLEPRHFGALDGMARILFYFEEYQDCIEIYKKMQLIMPFDKNLDYKIDRVKEAMSLKI